MLDWHQHLTSDEMPPEWMWALDDEIIDWMDRITEERREKYGLNNDNDSSEDRQAGGMTLHNEYAKGRR